jgi:hypothetical protein
MRRVGKVEQRAIDIKQYCASPKIDRVDNHRRCPMVSSKFRQLTEARFGSLAEDHKCIAAEPGPIDFDQF